MVQRDGVYCVEFEFVDRICFSDAIEVVEEVEDSIGNGCVRTRSSESCSDIAGDFDESRLSKGRVGADICAVVARNLKFKVVDNSLFGRLHAHIQLDGNCLSCCFSLVLS